MTGPIDTATVEVRADTSKVKSDVDNGIRKPFDDAAKASTARMQQAGRLVAAAIRPATTQALNFAAGMRSSDAAASAFTGRLGSAGGVVRNFLQPGITQTQNFVSGLRSSDAAASAFTGRLGTVGGAVRSFLQPGIAQARNFSAGLRDGDSAASALTGRMGTLGGVIRGGFGASALRVTDFVAGIKSADAAQSAFTGKMGTFGGFLSSTWRSGATGARDLASAIGTGVSGSVDRLTTKIKENRQEIVSSIGGVATGAFNSLKSNVDSNYSGILSLTKYMAIFGGVGAGAAFAVGGALGGAAIAGVALGAVLLKDNQTLINSYTNLGNTIKTQLTSAAAPLVGPLNKAAGEFLKTFQAILPQIKQIFSAAAGYVAPLAEGITGLFAQIMPGITTLMTHLGPVVEGIADLLANIGGGVGQLFANLTPAINAVGAALSAIGPNLADILSVIGSILGGIAQAGAPILTALMPVIDQLVNGLAQVLIPVFKGLAPIIVHVAGELSPLIDAFMNLAAMAIPPLIALFDDLGGLLMSTLIPALIQIINAAAPLIGVFINMLSPIMPLVSVVALLAGQLAEYLAPILMELLPIVSSIATTISQLFAKALQQLANMILPLLPSLGQLAQLIGGLVLMALNAIAPIIPIIVNALGALLNAVLPIIPPLLQMAATLISALAPILPLIANLIGSLIQAIMPLLPPLLQLIQAIFPVLIQVINALMPIIQLLANILSDVLAVIINTIVVPALKLITMYIQNFVAPVLMWLINTVVKPVFTAIGQAISFAWNNVIKPVFEALKVGIDAVGSFFNNVKDTIGRVWNAIGDIAMKPVRFIVNTVLDDGLIAGWNKVVDFLHLGSLHIPPIPRLATGGIIPGYTPGRDTTTVAVGGGEAVMRPEWTRAAGAGYVHAANAAARRGGTRGASAFIADNGLPTFARGGVVGRVSNGIQGEFAGGGIISWLGDVASSVGGALSGAFTGVLNFGGKVLDFMSDPIGAMEGLLNGIMSQLATGSLGDVGKVMELVTQAPKGLITGMVQKIKDWWHSLMSSGASAGGAGVQRWSGLVLQVLGMLGQPASLLPNVLRRMNQESGGNPSAINNWDVNARNGVPSQGLMQTIPPTFAAYAGPFAGLGILNPLANIYAGLNYAIHRYPSLQYAMDKPGGYRLGGLVKLFDSGGLLMPGQYAYNASRSPEPVFNGAQWSAITSSLDVKNAASELLNQLVSGGSVFEDFSFRGMSSNLASNNDLLANLFYGNGGQFNGGQMIQFLSTVTNAAARTTSASKELTSTTQRTGDTIAEKLDEMIVLLRARQVLRATLSLDGKVLQQWFQETEIMGGL